jgi:hypothetical protein
MTLTMTASTTDQAVKVTLDTFVRAETDAYLGRFVAPVGTGRFLHFRELAPIDKQDVVRMNRDTIYSSAVADLGAGPATVTLPDGGDRFISMLVINQDHYALGTHYEPGRYTFTEDEIGTRYVVFIVRIFVNPNDPADMAEVHALQDALAIEPAAAGRFEAPNWDQASLAAIREAVKALSAVGNIGFGRAFGRREEVNPIHHLLGAAVGWGANPPRDARYDSVEPEHADGTTPYELTVKDVPVDGFWSISVYNEDGYFVKNDADAYSLNNRTASTNADGSVTIRFGGPDPSAPNYLPIMPGWNYTVRLYRPRPEILDGTWRFPKAQPVR